MNYKIENDILKVEISDVGAELMSIVKKADGIEYLWQGDKQYWGGRAYNLFPICGRLTDGKYSYEGKTYEMNLNGFLRKCTLQAQPIANDCIEFSLSADEKILAMYPFEFRYSIRYTLLGATIIMDICVENNDIKPMYFALGGHPGFRVPLTNEKFESFSIQFDENVAPHEVVMSDTCFSTHQTVPFALDEQFKLSMRHSLFDKDAIILQNAGTKFVLFSSESDRSVTVTIPPQMKYVGLWHAPKTEAPYVAIEPWTSVPAYDGEIDDLTTKRDMTILEAHSSYELSWSIAIQ